MVFPCYRTAYHPSVLKARYNYNLEANVIFAGPSTTSDEAGRLTRQELVDRDVNKHGARSTCDSERHPRVMSSYQAVKG